MTELRAHLADALQGELDEHGYEDDDEKRGQVAHHFADVLLSLPGIAIAELPEPWISADTYTSWRYFDHGEDEYVTFPCIDDEIHVSGIGSYTPAEARAFAFALLAAASLAENR